MTAYKQVPLEPTPEMMLAAGDAAELLVHEMKKAGGVVEPTDYALRAVIYRTMLAASPEPVESADNQATIAFLSKICSAAASDYAGIITLLENVVGSQFEDAFKNAARECRETSEFMKLAAEGRASGLIYDDELSKSVRQCDALRDVLTDALSFMKEVRDQHGDSGVGILIREAESALSNKGG